MPEKLRPETFLHNYTEDILNRIVAGLRAPDSQAAEVTHELRKGLKRIRALVKLIRHKQPDEIYSETNVVLRDWGRIFSDLRDAHVHTEVLGQLSELPKLKALRSDLIRLSGINRKEISALKASLITQENKFSWIKQEIESTGEIETYFEVPELTWEDTKAGLEKSFRKSFESYQLARKHNHPEDLHEWRKRLKDFQYQLEFFDHVGNIETHSRLELSTEINEYLGTDQDYFNLSLWIMYHNKSFSNQESYSLLMDKIKQLSSDQQKLAFKKAERFYSD